MKEDMKMKKSLMLTLFMSLVVFAGSAWADDITLISDPSVNVGSVDNLINSAKLANSGDATEIAWVNSVLGTSFTTDDLTKYTNSSPGWLWEETSVDGVWAIDLKTDPEYFYIKTGGGAATAGDFDHFLYENLDDFNWGVVDLLAIGVEINNWGAISHVGEIGGQGTEVPEPGTMVLLGLGLIGLAGLRKKF
jgi:hypothetical protein